MTQIPVRPDSFEGATCARATTSLGNGRGTFGGASGTYTITVRYHDEDDGQSTFRLRVAGVVVDTRVADVDDHTWKLWTISGVSIANGAEVLVEGARQAGEHARIDYIEIQ